MGSLLHVLFKKHLAPSKQRGNTATSYATFVTAHTKRARTFILSCRPHCIIILLLKYKTAPLLWEKKKFWHMREKSSDNYDSDCVRKTVSQLWLIAAPVLRSVLCEVKQTNHCLQRLWQSEFPNGFLWIHAEDKHIIHRHEARSASHVRGCFCCCCFFV